MKVVISWIVCLVIFAAAASAPLVAGAEQDFEVATKAWEKAFNSGDAGAVANLYGQDAMLFPPGEEIVRGRDAVKLFWDGLIATGCKADIDVLETTIEGRLAYRLGHYRLTDADDMLLDRGKFVEVWKRAGGKWQLHRDIWNTSLSVETEPDPDSE